MWRLIESLVTLCTVSPEAQFEQNWKVCGELKSFSLIDVSVKMTLTIKTVCVQFSHNQHIELAICSEFTWMYLLEYSNQWLESIKISSVCLWVHLIISDQIWKNSLTAFSSFSFLKDGLEVEVKVTVTFDNQNRINSSPEPHWTFKVEEIPLEHS